MTKYHSKTFIKKVTSTIGLSALLLLNAVGLSGCNTVKTHCETVKVGNSYVQVGPMCGFEKHLVKGGDFWITTYQRVKDKNMPYVFYIEGDGRAFNGKYRVSNNPTPKNKMFINLASRDTRPNVVYIARPCQFTPKDLNPKCSSTKYWTSKRLSEDSVESINHVIEQINNGRTFSLVGYSGGGGIAVLIAERNPLVKDIITIAGNLDIEKFVEHHNVHKMVGSLNPIDYAKKINHIPQLHLTGGKDNIVPPFIADNFVRESDSRCVKQTIFPKRNHSNGWENIWEYVLTLPVSCYD